MFILKITIYNIKFTIYITNDNEEGIVLLSLDNI